MTARDVSTGCPRRGEAETLQIYTVTSLCRKRWPKQWPGITQKKNAVLFLMSYALWKTGKWKYVMQNFKSHFFFLRAPTQCGMYTLHSAQKCKCECPLILFLKPWCSLLKYFTVAAELGRVWMTRNGSQAQWLINWCSSHSRTLGRMCKQTWSV